MDAIKLAVTRPVILLGLGLLAAATLPGICIAEQCATCAHDQHGRYFDGTTKCRWHRTSHVSTSIWRPLTPYFIPRPADPCLYGGYGRSCYEMADYADGSLGSECFAEGAERYESGSLSGYEELPATPVGLERLGQIPNDTGISGGAGPAPAARAGR